MADGTTKPIEEIATGDKVQATDPETGETTPKDVTATIQGEGSKNLVEIVIDTDGDSGSASDTITATDEHPFWVTEAANWVDAKDLQPGQWLQSSTGAHVQIKTVKQWTESLATVRNLTVADVHTYYVLAGTTPVLVHNYNVTGVGCGVGSDIGSSIPTRQPASVGNAGGNTNYRQTFYNANPGTQGNVWVHHAIEQQALRRYPGLFSADEIHSLENLRGIPKGVVNSRVHLSAIRNLWNDFYSANPSPTRQGVLAYATEVDDQLGQWFTPRIR